MDVNVGNLLNSLWENYAVNNRQEFLLRLQKLIPELTILDPSNPNYKTPIDFKEFISDFQTYLQRIDKSISIIDFLIEKMSNKGIDKLGGSYYTISYNLNDFKSKIKDLFLKLSGDFESLSGEYTLNEIIQIKPGADEPIELLNLFIKESIGYIYNELLSIGVYITRKELHGGDFIIQYNFTEIKNEFKKIEMAISNDLRFAADNAIQQGKTHKEVMDFLKGKVNNVMGKL